MRTASARVQPGVGGVAGWGSEVGEVLPATAPGAGKRALRRNKAANGSTIAVMNPAWIR